MHVYVTSRFCSTILEHSQFGSCARTSGRRNGVIYNCSACAWSIRWSGDTKIFAELIFVTWVFSEAMMLIAIPDYSSIINVYNIVTWFNLVKKNTWCQMIQMMQPRLGLWSSSTSLRLTMEPRATQRICARKNGFSKCQEEKLIERTGTFLGRCLEQFFFFQTSLDRLHLSKVRLEKPKPNRKYPGGHAKHPPKLKLLTYVDIIAWLMALCFFSFFWSNKQQTKISEKLPRRKCWPQPPVETLSNVDMTNSALPWWSREVPTWKPFRHQAPRFSRGTRTLRLHGWKVNKTFMGITCLRPFELWATDLWPHSGELW